MTAAYVLACENSGGIMDSIQAMKMAALVLRARAASAAKSSDRTMLEFLATGIDEGVLGYERATEDRSKWWRAATDEGVKVEELKQQLANALKDRDWWRKNAESSVERQGQRLTENIKLRKKVRELRKELRAAKGGG